ncbi:MAG: hypothetical protein M0031_13500 [Thermaerobacter sp.]|jgi:hypothetical protein|nr:hypothetical protein [Thermaerobacter sp.]
MPANGLRGQVLRSCNCPGKSAGDLGVGRHVGLSDLRVETDGPLGEWRVDPVRPMVRPEALPDEVPEFLAPLRDCDLA